MITRFFDRLDRLDDIIATGAQVVDITRQVMPLMQEHASRKYFLDALPDAEWLTPLEEHGFFNFPPNPIHEKDTTSYPIWSEGRYLAKISSKAPEIVRDIILKIPDTDNIYVLDDLVEAVNGMPADIAKDLVPQIIFWLEKPRRLPYSDSLGKLLVKLAQGGEVHCALELARSLLCVEQSSKKNMSGLPEIQSRMDTWTYENILSDSIPCLAAEAGIPTLELLCGLLDQALSISMSDYAKARGDDYSYIWHAEVEGNRESGYGDIRNLLVGAIRDTAVSVTADSANLTSKVVHALENKSWLIFRRIALHVIRVSSKPPMNDIARILTGKRRFNKMGELEHEYTMLLKQFFGMIKPIHQKKILGWIAEGPNLKRLEQKFQSWSGRQATHEDIADYVNRWRYMRLALIAESLPNDLHQQYLQLKQEYDDIEGLETRRAVHFRGTIGSTSPKSADEINSMPIADLMNYLNTWKEEGRFESPSYDGLAHELTAAVTNEPERYADKAHLFQERNRPDYMSALLHGFRSAIDNKKRFTWPRILEFCRWIAEQSVVAPSKSQGQTDETWDWRSAQYAVVMLLEKAFQNSHPDLALDLREEAWAAIEPIVMHPTDQQEPSTETDPSSSIDSTRSEALEAVIHYALWIYRCTYGYDSDVCCSFDIMPKVRKALDYCLDTGHDSSTSVHMVYGRLFPQLVRLDREWIKANINRIFPRGDKGKQLRDAAWNSYIKFCHPNSNVFSILVDEYKWAVDRLAVGDTIGGYFGKSDDDLAEHLMVFYWWGKLDLSKDGLVKAFFKNAQDELRSHAISFVGRSFSNAEGSIPESVIDRLKKLWEFRIFEIRTSSTSKSYHKEISKFGWWFTSEKFPNEWALKQVHDVIKLVHWIEPESKVFNRLVNDMSTAPETVLDCIEDILDGASEMERWRLDSIIKPAHVILKEALVNESVKDRAIELANRFGAQGYIKDFRDLGVT